jgi:hypothetical protein
MNITPATAARQIAVAREARETAFHGDRLAYSTRTGDAVRPVTLDMIEAHRANCPDLAKYGEHVLDYVEADLPGDRSVGYCSCGQYIDTGTWDERNA